MASLGKRWVDISPLLSRTCDEMATGQLIHGENFSLFEAMVAIEVMDPKMDSAMLHLHQGEGGNTEGDSAPPLFRTSEEAIAGGAAPLDLTPGELQDVMDHLLTAQAVWWGGHSMAQTLFSCLYLLSMPRTQQHPLLHAFCRAVVALCNTVRGITIQANTREEEDFVTTAFGLPLAEHVGGRSVLALRQEQSELRSAVELGESGLAGTGSAADTEAILLRVSFLLALFDALDELGRAKSVRDFFLSQKAVHSAETALCALREASASASASSPAAAEPSPTPPARSSSPAQDHATPEDAGASECSAESRDPTAAAVGLPGRAGSSRSTSRSTCTASGRAAVGFCESVCFSLMPPAPMRVVTLCSWHQALDQYSSLLRQLSAVCCCHAAVGPSLLRGLNYLSRFQATDPGPVARACMAVAVFSDKKLFGLSTEDFILTTVGIRGLVEDHKPRPQGGAKAGGSPASGRESKDVLRKFAWRAGHAVESVFGALCANAPRQRRQLGKSLSEWDAVLQAAQQGDTDPRVKAYGLRIAKPGWWRETMLVSWTVETVCRCMLRYLLLGLPSQLYAPRELLSVYWYLEHVVATLLHNVTAREAAVGPTWPGDMLPSATGGLEERLQDATSGEGNGAGKEEAGGGKGGAGSKLDKQLLANGEAQGPKGEGPVSWEPSLDMRLHHTYHLLCKGTVRMVIALSLDGKLPLRPLKFNSEEELYEQRFEVLRAVQVPEPQSYAKFVEGTSPAGLRVPDLLQLAHEYFQTAGAQVGPLRAQSEAQERGTGAREGLRGSPGGEGDGTSGASPKDGPSQSSPSSKQTQTQASGGQCAAGPQGSRTGSPLPEIMSGRRHLSEELDQLEKVILRNLLALQVSHRAGPGPTLKASFDFSAHPFFPVMSLRRS